MYYLSYLKVDSRSGRPRQRRHMMTEPDPTPEAPGTPTFGPPAPTRPPLRAAAAPYGPVPISDLMPRGGAAAAQCGVAEQLAVCCGCCKELPRRRAMRCSRCRLAFYCSRACQEVYHKRHSRWCRKQAVAQAQLRERYPTALVGVVAHSHAGGHFCPAASP